MSWRDGSRWGTCLVCQEFGPGIPSIWCPSTTRSNSLRQSQHSLVLLPSSTRNVKTLILYGLEQKYNAYGACPAFICHRLSSQNHVIPQALPGWSLNTEPGLNPEYCQAFPPQRLHLPTKKRQEKITRLLKNTVPASKSTVYCFVLILEPHY